MAVPTLAALSDMGLSEVVVRVSKYNFPVGNRGADSSMTPVEWQAIAKNVNAALPWSVAVRDNPDVALADALSQFQRLNEKKKIVRKPSPVPAPAADLDAEAASLI